MSIQASIPTNREGFKKLVADFLKSAPDADQDALSAGFKCVSLAYFGLDVPADSGEQKIAESYLQYAMRRHTEYDVAMTIREVESLAHSLAK